MSEACDRTLFWCLIGGQAIGSQFLIWTAVPVYHGMRTGALQAASARHFALGLAAAALMQACHWPALALRPRVRVGRNVVLGHLLVWIGELSLFFSAALATLIVFDRFGEVEWIWWKVASLAAILFAVTSYKYQIISLGEAMIEAAPNASNPAANARI